MCEDFIRNKSEKYVLEQNTSLELKYKQTKLRNKKSKAKNKKFTLEDIQISSDDEVSQLTLQDIVDEYEKNYVNYVKI